jgi:hypothetical protein
MVVEKQKDKYFFDKNIFRLAILGMIIFTVAIWAGEGFKNPFSKEINLRCPADVSRCENPLYHNYDYKNILIPSQQYLIEEEYINAGFEINPIPEAVKLFGYFSVVIIALAFCINHILHNQGFDFNKKLSGVKNIMEENNNVEVEEKVTLIEHKAYCVKCKQKRIIKDVVIQDLNTRRGIKRFAKGTCNVCNTKVCVTIKKD